MDIFSKGYFPRCALVAVTDTEFHLPFSYQVSQYHEVLTARRALDTESKIKIENKFNLSAEGVKIREMVGVVYTALQR